MIAYKGFNKDMTCRGFQFEEGKTYEEDSAVLCEKGFHACEMPLNVFEYYAPGSSVYHRVELEDVSPERKEDSKVCAKKIKIGARLSIGELVKLQAEYVKDHTTTEHTDPKRATAGNSGAATAGNSGAATAGNRGAATAGDYGAATAGNSGAATAGYRGAATAGDYGAATAGNSGAATAGNSGAATAGNSGAATAGYSGAATAGDCGAATAGDYGAATAGNSGAATAGYRGAATSRGSSASGNNGVSVARGTGVRVKGGLGAVLVIAEECRDSCDISAWKAAVVDGKAIKPDTWYKLEDGKFVEV